MKASYGPLPAKRWKHYKANHHIILTLRKVDVYNWSQMSKCSETLKRLNTHKHLGTFKFHQNKMLTNLTLITPMWPVKLFGSSFTIKMATSTYSVNQLELGISQKNNF